ncbi:unnamed protein product [Owenia fusiformis]|uniref:Uncharacterized protein n=1 Tax=Owenia fusiformis TaxID=6347 RepID=A0A8J1XZP9_OWEFU|nr:unnamed protein product [Owenia fusiformis]
MVFQNGSLRQNSERINWKSCRISSRSAFHCIKMATKAMGLLKRGWTEIPEVMAPGVLFLGALVASPFILKRIKDKGADRVHMHKMEYTVIRDTDIKIDDSNKDVFN